jgi:hypothetical protein
MSVGSSNVIPFPRRPLLRPLGAPFAIWQLWLGIGLLMFAALHAPARRR